MHVKIFFTFAFASIALAAPATQGMSHLLHPCTDPASFGPPAKQRVKETAGKRSSNVNAGILAAADDIVARYIDEKTEEERRVKRRGTMGFFASHDDVMVEYTQETEKGEEDSKIKG